MSVRIVYFVPYCNYADPQVSTSHFLQTTANHTRVHLLLTALLRIQVFSPAPTIKVIIASHYLIFCHSVTVAEGEGCKRKWQIRKGQRGRAMTIYNMFSIKWRGVVCRPPLAIKNTLPPCLSQHFECSSNL